MEMTGEYSIPASRREVWAALNDPEVLRRCVPGCERVERKSDTEFEAAVTAKVGPVKARFTGKVTLSDLDPPRGYTISGEGVGGAAGFARGGARVVLHDEDGGTRLVYRVEATVGGRLAQIGSRLIDATAKKMADEFFTRFCELAGGEAAPAAAQGGAAEDGTPGLGQVVWAGGVIALVLLSLWYYSTLQ